MYRIPLVAVLALFITGCMSAVPDTAPPLAALSDADWTTTAESFRGDAPMRLQVFCPSNPNADNVGTVWGAEIYSDDSSICAAAVHAGRISFAEGGSVTVELRPGQATYRGTESNGVASQAYGAWEGSFIVLD